MSSLVSAYYTPQVDVEAWTPQGAHYHAELMADLAQVATSKTIGQAAGTFQLTFTARRTTGGTWADRLPFRTYVEIRAGTGLSAPVTIMRGLVDSPEQAMQLPAMSGGPQREAVVSGRDLGAVLQDWQILYLWGLDPMATLLVEGLNGAGDVLAGSLGVSVGTTSANTILQHFCNRTVHDAVETLRTATGAPITHINAALSVPSQYQVNFINLQPFQGAYDQMFNYYASPPFGEWFLWDSPTNPEIVVRQTPYKNPDTGQYPYPYGGTATENGAFPDVEVPSTTVTDHNLTINGASEVYTYYVTMPDLASGSGQTFANWFYANVSGALVTNQHLASQPGANPFFDAEHAKTWGIQPLQLTTPWISILQQAESTQPALMTTWLVNVFHANDRLASGTLTVHGDPAYTVGRYVYHPDTQWEAYIEQVDHQIDLTSPAATWTTDLGVVRGRVRGATG